MIMIIILILILIITILLLLLSSSSSIMIVIIIVMMMIIIISCAALAGAGRAAGDEGAVGLHPPPARGPRERRNHGHRQITRGTQVLPTTVGRSWTLWEGR
jgi:hypothetical protein